MDKKKTSENSSESSYTSSYANSSKADDFDRAFKTAKTKS